MATRMCDVCGIRPAVVTVRRVVPGEGQRVEHLCEIHAAEAGVGRSTFGGSSPRGRKSLRRLLRQVLRRGTPRGDPWGRVSPGGRQNRWT